MTMKLFIDTADIEQVRTANAWGILDGVTTNPSHVSKTGADPRALYPAICAEVDGPVSLEAIGLETEQIVNEGRQLAAIADNAVVKVPVTAKGLAAVKQLSAEGIKTNVTVVFSPLQAMLAAKCGATYVSPFVGRLDAIGHDGMLLVRQIKTIFNAHAFTTQVLAAAIRDPIHVLDSALAGADVATMSFDVMKALYDHPLTDAGIEQFLKDWKTVPAS
jgi:transaldolase